MIDQRKVLITIVVIVLALILYKYSTSFSILTDSRAIYSQQVGNYLAKSTYNFGSNTTTNLYPEANNGALTLSTYNNITYDSDYKIEVSYSRGYNNDRFITTDLTPPGMDSFLVIPLDLGKLSNASFTLHRKTSHTCDHAGYTAGNSAIYLSSEDRDVLLYTFPGEKTNKEETVSFKLLNIDNIYVLKYLDSAKEFNVSGNMSLIFISSIGPVCEPYDGMSAVEILEINNLKIYEKLPTVIISNLTNQTNVSEESFKCCFVRTTTNSSIISNYTWRSQCFNNEQVVFVTSGGNALGTKSQCEIESNMININVTGNQTNTTCGNNVCDSGETKDSCASDCKSTNLTWLWVSLIIIFVGGIGFFLGKR